MPNFYQQNYSLSSGKSAPVRDLCELNDQSFEVPLEKPAAQYLAIGG